MQSLREYKLVVLGCTGVGKSALTAQFTENHFFDGDVNFINDEGRKQCIIDNEVALLDVLDHLGNEYFALREQYIRKGEGFLLVYSITSRHSIEEISSFHQRVLQIKEQDSFPIIIVANKCDLENERVVSINEGRDLAKHLGCKFIETSAEYGVNVDDAFRNLVREIRKYNNKHRPVLTGNGVGMGPHAPGCCPGCVVL